MNQNEYLTAAEIAERLKIDLGVTFAQSTFRIWEQRYGHSVSFPHGKKRGNSWTWPYEDLVDWMIRTGRMS